MEGTRLPLVPLGFYGPEIKLSFAGLSIFSFQKEREKSASPTLPIQSITELVFFDKQLRSYQLRLLFFFLPFIKFHYFITLRYIYIFWSWNEILKGNFEVAEPTEILSKRLIQKVFQITHVLRTYSIFSYYCLPLPDLWHPMRKRRKLYFQTKRFKFLITFLQNSVLFEKI